MPLLGSLVVVNFRVNSRILHETSVLLSLLLPRYFAATITFISTTGPSRDVVCVILSILFRGRVILPYPLLLTLRGDISIEDISTHGFEFSLSTEVSRGVVAIYCFWVPKIQVRTLVGANCQYAQCGPSSPERLVRRQGECPSSHYLRFRCDLWVYVGRYSRGLSR